MWKVNRRVPQRLRPLGQSDDRRSSARQNFEFVDLFTCISVRSAVGPTVFADIICIEYGDAGNSSDPEQVQSGGRNFLFFFTHPLIFTC